MLYNEAHMKRNTFYILAGIVGLALVGIFWLSVEIHNPTLITVAFIAGIVLLYWLRTRISDRIEDERTILISQKSAMRTIEVFWVVFFAISLGGVVLGLGAPGFPKPPHRPPDEGLIPLGHLGFMQMTLLCLMIFLYVGFRMYYARQYGEWDTDEEQD
jgi:uncharacterized membrane protein